MPQGTDERPIEEEPQPHCFRVSVQNVSSQKPAKSKVESWMAGKSDDVVLKAQTDDSDIAYVVKLKQASKERPLGQRFVQKAEQ